jgi:hypothetical protein
MTYKQKKKNLLILQIYTTKHASDSLRRELMGGDDSQLKKCSPARDWVVRPRRKGVGDGCRLRRSRPRVQDDEEDSMRWRKTLLCRISSWKKMNEVSTLTTSLLIFWIFFPLWLLIHLNPSTMPLKINSSIRSRRKLGWPLFTNDLIGDYAGNSLGYYYPRLCFDCQVLSC